MFTLYNISGIKYEIINVFRFFILNLLVLILQTLTSFLFLRFLNVTFISYLLFKTLINLLTFYLIKLFVYINI